jgi:hypothetical protein
VSEVQIPEKIFESFFEDINTEYEEKICLQKTLLNPELLLLYPNAEQRGYSLP